MPLGVEGAGGEEESDLGVWGEFRIENHPHIGSGSGAAEHITHAASLLCTALQPVVISWHIKIVASPRAL